MRIFNLYLLIIKISFLTIILKGVINLRSQRIEVYRKLNLLVIYYFIQ